MIGFLSGIVKSISLSQTTILVNGVGYLVHIPTNLSLRLNEPSELYIHTHVREDLIALYGFKDETSLDLFDKLLSVSGVGPKSALAIVSVASADVVKKAIESSNLDFFTAISGIGKKGAQKIIIELKPKLTKMSADLNSLEGNPELTQALAQLGFSKNEIISVVSNVDKSAALSIQIKQALKLFK